jgi:hypothetical protein
MHSCILYNVPSKRTKAKGALRVKMKTIRYKLLGDRQYVRSMNKVRFTFYSESARYLRCTASPPRRYGSQHLDTIETGTKDYSFHIFGVHQRCRIIQRSNQTTPLRRSPSPTLPHRATRIELLKKSFQKFNDGASFADAVQQQSSTTV